jgi:hypothetical protein
MAIAAEVAVAEVVGKEEYDIRMLNSGTTRTGCRKGQQAQTNQQTPDYVVMVNSALEQVETNHSNHPRTTRRF